MITNDTTKLLSSLVMSYVCFFHTLYVQYLIR